MTWNVKSYTDFTGGENRRVVSELIAPNQVQLALNCIISAEGALESRHGKTKINTASLPSGIRAMWRWEKSDGTKYLTVVSANKVYSVEWDGSSTIATFGTAIKTLLSSTNKIRGCVWKDNLILSDGVNNPFRYDGTTCTDLGGTPPKFNIFCVYASKLFVVDYDNPSQIRVSGLEDYDTWNALDVYNIRSNDGDEITALDPQSNGLMICKRNSTWALFGFDRYDIQISQGPVSPSGAVSQDLIQNGLFVGRDNFYMGALPNVTPLPDSHGISIQGLDASDLSNACSAFSSADAIAVMSVGGQVYCLNGKFSWAVTTWDNLNIGALAYSRDTGCILVGDKDTGDVFCLNGADDNGGVFYTDIRTACFDMTSPRSKVFRNVHHRFEILNGGYDLLMAADVDFGRLTQMSTTQFLTVNAMDWGDDAWATADWGSATDARSDYIHWLHGHRGNYLSVGFKTASRVKFLGYTVKFMEVGNII